MASKSKKSLALHRARERIYKNLLKRSWVLTPDPAPVRATAVTQKRSLMRADGMRGWSQSVTGQIRA